MSKKITSFLTLLLMLFVSTTAGAQEIEELGQKAVSFGVAMESITPNTWYFLHQGRGASNGSGDYTPIQAGQTPEEGGFMADQGEGADVLKLSIDNISGTPASTAAGYLVRFIETGTEGVYNIQFGTGNYLTEPAGKGSSQTLSSTSNINDAGDYALYPTNPEEGPGVFGFNWWYNNNYQERIDNNGVGYTVVTWESGKQTAIAKSNSLWAIVEVIWEDMGEREAAIYELVETANTYSPYLEACVPGTAPGQYGQAEWDAFKAALEAADLDNAEVDITSKSEEEIRQLTQAIIDAYNALIASRVPYVIADGYYFIKSAFITDGHSAWYEVNDEETVYVDKYMQSTKEGSTIYGTWGSKDEDDVISKGVSLWYITNKEDGLYDVQNMGTKGRFTTVETSANVVMAEDSESLMAFDLRSSILDEETQEYTTIINIRVSSQLGGNYFYLHAGGHSAGAGKNGKLVGYANGGASEWSLVAVDEEVAKSILEEYAIIADHEAMLSNYQEMLADAAEKLEIAKDLTVIVDKETPLITSASQFSSPYSQNDHGAADGGNLSDGVLLDGDGNTFWHSYWGGGSATPGTHYLAVEINEPEAVDVVAFQFTRRPVEDDHVTKWGVYGTNDLEAEKNACTKLANVSTPYGTNTETLTSSAFKTQHFTYLRFYAEQTIRDRGYFHVSEFQLYPAEIQESETSQYNVMGSLATRLEEVIAELANVETEDISATEYNKLKEAYDAFIAKFVDPTELRQTMASVADVADVIVEGTNPGFWPVGFGTTGLQGTIDAAKAYDEAGDYTQEKSQQYIDQLKEQAENIYASAIGIQEGKWYRIRFATEEEFDEYGWDKVAGNGYFNEPLNKYTSEPLFGKYVAPSVLNISKETYFNDEGQEVSVDIYRVECVDAEEVGMGNNVFFDELNNLGDPDLALFRFVAVGDSAYLLQNKATKLFVRSGYTGQVHMSVHPALFNVRAIGYGENVIAAKTLTGSNQYNLHGQVNQNTLVTWDVDYPGSRSGLYLEEAEDVADDYDGEEFNIPAVAGKLEAYCFPMPIAKGSDGNIWVVSSIEGTKVTLAEAEEVEAGRPFFYMLGEAEDYDEANEAEWGKLRHKYEVVTEPQTQAVLKGTFDGGTVGAGVLVTDGNTLVVSKRSTTTVGANSAYIATEEGFDVTAEIEVIFDPTAEDGISEAIANVSKSGAVYTLDGRQVSQKATLNDLKGYGKGIYILNGIKVVVK